MFKSTDSQKSDLDIVTENTTKLNRNTAKFKTKKVGYCRWIRAEDDSSQLIAEWIFDDIIIADKN